MPITSWVHAGSWPEDFYDLLGRSRFDPATDELLAAIRTANRELWPYQNHHDETTRDRALRLLRELGRAEDVFSSPGKRQTYDEELARTLIQRLEAANGYNLAILAAWLRDPKHVHPDGVGLVVNVLPPGLRQLLPTPAAGKAARPPAPGPDVRQRDVERLLPERTGAGLAGMPETGRGSAGPGPSTANYNGTMIESDEAIRDAIRPRLKPATGNLPALALAPSTGNSPAEARGPVQANPRVAGPTPVELPARPAATAANSSAVLFRPTIRPPVAILTVFDDGKDDGESIRIRSPKFVIGRSQGDLQIPIDGRISARHVEISLQANGVEAWWVVTDLQSTHGLFVRVTKTPLADGAELLVGGGRYRFMLPQSSAGPAGQQPPVPEVPNSFNETRGWVDDVAGASHPTLLELLGNEVCNRTLLARPEYWIGSDAACSISRPDDQFCEPRHVRIHRDAQGKWHAEHPKTRNGLWLRMNQVVVTSMVQFQIGEQRFKLKVG